MGSNLVIVAIPDEEDRVWKVSSEKVPHLTLLFLGEADQVDNSQQIVEFVEHAATTTLNRFHMSVDRRDELGDDKADVLFFKRKRWDAKAIYDFRTMLLKDNNIKTAYDSAEQFDGPWLPHLTLGYPEAPAKPMPENWGSDKFYNVEFTKIAVWFGDFEGPEFLLKDWWDETEDLHDNGDMDLAMSSINQERVSAGMAAIQKLTEDGVKLSTSHGEVFVDGLMHYGKKGMKWGVRKESPSAVSPKATSTVPHGTKRKTKVEVEGGENHPAHTDALKVAEAKAKLRKSGPSALSNNELREVATRVQLEQQVKQLVQPAGKKFVKGLLKTQGNQQANQFVSTQVKKKVSFG